MNAIVLRNLIIEEIRRVPDADLADLHQWIRQFRLRTERSPTFDTSLPAPGNWDSLADQIFNQTHIR
ncbi:MAG: hypothetical protein H6970_11200 [Gammaproteobacteria bacterium]|nr:hypothetical protein [Gammaproteobacteria bacterium]MCP5425617.1 hypothetical protein [Gammaproteobacteria bacterium]MCP5458983.1 hypothetical protein [Gammaproteobacteria bacterium]